MLVEKRVGAKGQPCLYWTSIPFFIPHQLCMPFLLRGNVHSMIITSPVWKSEVNSQPPLHIGRRHTTRAPQSDTPAGPCIRHAGQERLDAGGGSGDSIKLPVIARLVSWPRSAVSTRLSAPQLNFRYLASQRPWVQFPPQSQSVPWVGELLLEA